MHKSFHDGNFGVMCNEECTPESITKFGCEANIKWMQEDQFLVWCVGSLISCCCPNWEVMPSIFELSYEVLSLLHQRFDLMLKSPKTTVRKGLFAKILSRFRSKFFRNVSKSSWDWLGERYKTFRSWCDLVGIECLLLSTEIFIVETNLPRLTLNGWSALYKS